MFSLCNAYKWKTILFCEIKFYVNLWYGHIYSLLINILFYSYHQNVVRGSNEMSVPREFWHWDTWHDWSSNTLCHWHFIPAMNFNDSFIIEGRFTLSTSSVICCAKFILGLNPLTWLELHVREVWLSRLWALKQIKVFIWQPGKENLNQSFGFRASKNLWLVANLVSLNKAALKCTF